jgi:hypothetical protein
LVIRIERINARDGLDEQPVETERGFELVDGQFQTKGTMSKTQRLFVLLVKLRTLLSKVIGSEWAQRVSGLH